MPSNSNPTILIRMPNWLGDCVMAMPAVHHLTTTLPNAHIYLAGREQFRDFFSAQTGIAGFIPAPASGFGKLLRSMSETRRLVKNTVPASEDIDLGILFTNSLSTAAWMWRAGTKTRLGYDLDCRRFFLTHPVPCGEVESGWHFVLYYLWLAKCAEAALKESGQTLDPSESGMKYVAPSVQVDEGAFLEAKALLKLHGITDGYIVIAPASAYGPVKDWPPEYWRELVGMIRSRLGLPVVVTGGGGQAEVCGQIASGQELVVDVSGKTGMDVFAGLLAGASGFVGGDSGGAHVAAALGVPTVVIFGITNPVRTCPGGEAVCVLGGNTGTGIKLSSPEARRQAMEALAAITPEQVFSSLEKVITQKAQESVSK